MTALHNAEDLQSDYIWYYSLRHQSALKPATRSCPENCHTIEAARLVCPSSPFSYGGPGQNNLNHDSSPCGRYTRLQCWLRKTGATLNKVGTFVVVQSLLVAGKDKVGRAWIALLADSYTCWSMVRSTRQFGGTIKWQFYVWLPSLTYELILVTWNTEYCIAVAAT